MRLSRRRHEIKHKFQNFSDAAAAPPSSMKILNAAADEICKYSTLSFSSRFNQRLSKQSRHSSDVRYTPNRESSIINKTQLRNVIIC